MDHLITYTPPTGHSKYRAGRTIDGGYICVDGYDYDLFLSCGIADDVSFEVAFLQDHPTLPAYAFDGTVERPIALPDCVTFIKKNIAHYESETTTNMWTLLSSHSNAFLKMDIEGAEWVWFDTLPVELLRNIRQIVVEVHGMLDNRWQAGMLRKKRVLRKLAETHTIVHVHGNNTAGVRYVRGCLVPYVLEITYLRKDAGHGGLNTSPFPVADLDYPNDVSIDEIRMEGWPFVSAATADAAPAVESAGSAGSV